MSTDNTKEVFNDRRKKGAGNNNPDYLPKKDKTTKEKEDKKE